MAAIRFGNGDELEFVDRLIEGDEAAALELDAFRPHLEHLLVSKGASPADATDVVGDVLGDCCGDNSKLKKFKGEGSLSSYLMSTARFAWIDRVRHESKSIALPDDPEHQDSVLAEAGFGGTANDSGQEEVIAILKEALLETFAETPPETLLLLRLVFEHDVNQKALMVPWACSEATISRRKDDALDTLRRSLIAKVHKIEPQLNLEWDDFMALCADSNILRGK
jgi:RNA polymerase sigma factor (sigma-70 family)